MLKVLKYLSYLVVNKLTIILFLDKYDQKKKQSFLTLVAKIILCKRKLIFNNFINYCDACVSCVFFFNRKHLDFFSLDCSFLNYFDYTNKLELFVNAKSIYSEYKVIFINNFISIDINYYFFVYYLSKKNNNIFFIFSFTNFFYKRSDHYIFFVSGKNHLYSKYILIKKKKCIDSYFIFTQLYFLCYKILTHENFLVKKFIFLNFYLQNKDLFFLEENLFFFKVVLKKHLEYL